MTENILVTGSAGFIGFHLCKRLLDEGYKVIGVDNYNDYYIPALKHARTRILKEFGNFREYATDLADVNSVKNIFRENKISVVCNLAAQAGVRYSLVNPYAYEKSNLCGFINLLEMIRHYEIPRLVYASSSSVYGGNKKIPFSENDPVDSPISLYAATKKANELIAHSYTHLYGFQSVGLRFFTVYGPWGRPDMAMWLFTEAMLKGKTIKVFNYGNMRRDFTFIDDIINGVCAALFSENLDKYEIFNLGNCKSEELLYMISIIEKELGIEAKKEMLPIQPGDVPETFADITKAREKLNFQPETTIEKGIPIFVEWFKQHPEFQ